MQKITFALFVMGTVAACHAQWLNYRDPRTPRTHDGKADLKAPAPRMPDGKPDLSGVWQVEPSPWTELKPLVGNMNDVFAPGDDLRDFSKYAINIFADFKPEDVPLRPEIKAALHRQQPEGDPCLPGGIPFVYLLPAPAKWIQTPGVIAIASEAMPMLRQIYLDGRKMPSGADPLWQGYSTGTWEGNTLVVESAGFNDKTVLDAMGHPHSESLHEVARYHRRDFGHLDVDVTLDDAKLYTKPFVIKYTLLLQPDTDILEFVCEENERDNKHLGRQ